MVNGGGLKISTHDESLKSGFIHSNPCDVWSLFRGGGGYADFFSCCHQAEDRQN
jgi:hypothetical protein